MADRLIPGETIGILGGGQLGRMMAVAAKHMGYRVAVLDPKPDCPCTQVADYHIEAAYDDLEAARNLENISDVITYEFENVDLNVADMLEKAGKLPQGALPLEITQNRQKEKQIAVETGLNVPNYEIVQTFDQVKTAIQSIGYPAILKTITGGYDGKGQVKLNKEEDLAEVESFIAPDSTYIIEAFIDFQKEVSVVFTRSQTGEITYFPVAENTHNNQILHRTQIPAAINDNVAAQAKAAAKLLAEHLQVVGTFTVELFVKDDQVYVNEMAPRPHNSGHYTIEACNVSQFEQHVRAICGLPLLKVQSFPAAVMLNILGKHREELFQNLARIQDFHLHDYGKEEARPERKMGHITIIGTSLDEIFQRMEENQLPTW
ncbi:N5-carboxyaminoimidazole ribonucleotide synthase [Thalassobacillus devorans]|uniref:N5-carboxyaminoimidazole ribonucleotide synthase n=1 Tax=Thalassobacillus devorans TaxID=279813 RepID=A0ABQ1PJC0_9BACI|nr:5-(carboxyamino)imidazole ribonucleotide synthase [Thalassobacillus devorans]NIK30092.1 5-(carboxyamino)imidazole ribonucleotide synthase [Thalassobacillus devorans]GGC98284.1 N5-carboxyaminoimidazole ribonucleotide synthase [Thalassobacillus devorans]